MFLKVALFLIQSNMTAADVLTKGKDIEFPESVVDLFMGMLGYPHHGLPKDVQAIVLKGRQPLTTRPVSPSKKNFRNFHKILRGLKFRVRCWDRSILMPRLRNLKRSTDKKWRLKTWSHRSFTPRSSRSTWTSWRSTAGRSAGSRRKCSSRAWSSVKSFTLICLSSAVLTVS